ncbi:Leucyl aminopeptidase yscIV [Orbilia oligospora]|nr:Leucyl aminopeptidase yscIV [Orbilia oligospora]KAF3178756.1 Leucyl aminopeptidase yscIV [Orbilia oligospora]
MYITPILDVAFHEFSVVLHIESGTDYNCTTSLLLPRSGVIAQIEVVRTLRRCTVNNAIRFCFFVAEIPRRLGSDYYLSSLSSAEKTKIVLNLGFNHLVSPNLYVHTIYNNDSAFTVNGESY